MSLQSVVIRKVKAPEGLTSSGKPVIEFQAAKCGMCVKAFRVSPY